MATLNNVFSNTQIRNLQPQQTSGMMLGNIVASTLGGIAKVKEIDKKYTEEEKREQEELDVITINDTEFNQRNKREELGFYTGNMSDEEMLQHISEEKAEWENMYSNAKTESSKGKYLSALTAVDKEFNTAYEKYTDRLTSDFLTDQIGKHISNTKATNDDFKTIVESAKGISKKATTKNIISVSKKVISDYIKSMPDDKATPEELNRITSGFKSYVKDPNSINEIEGLVSDKKEKYDTVLYKRDNDTKDSILLKSLFAKEQELESLIKESDKINDDGVKYNTQKTIKILMGQYESKRISKDNERRAYEEKELNALVDNITSKSLKYDKDPDKFVEIRNVKKDAEYNEEGKLISPASYETKVVFKQDKQYQKAVNVLKYLHGDSPNVLEKEIMKLDKEYDKAKELSLEIVQQDIYKPTFSGLSDEAKEAVNKNRDKNIGILVQSGEIERAIPLLKAKGSLTKDLELNIFNGLTSSDPDTITESLNKIATLESDMSVRHMINTNNKLKYIYSYAKLASRNGYSQAELDVINKIASGDTKYDGSISNAVKVLKGLKIDTRSEESKELVNEVAYMLANGLNPTDVEEIVPELIESKKFTTDEFEVKSHYAPSWASPTVIDKTVEALTKENEGLLRDGMSVVGDDKDNMIIYMGSGEKKRMLGVFNKEDYFNLLNMYRDSGLDEEYNKEIKEKRMQKLYRDYNNAKRTGKKVNGKTYTELFKEIESNYKDSTNLEKMFRGFSLIGGE